jgi:hypothetical protein
MSAFVYGKTVTNFFNQMKKEGFNFLPVLYHISNTQVLALILSFALNLILYVAVW